MVNDIGLRWKSGQLFPSGISTTNCVIITPGILDFFLMPAAESQYKRYQMKRAEGGAVHSDASRCQSCHIRPPRW